MRRFILQGNVENFKERLARAKTDSERARVNSLLAEAEREFQGCTKLWNQNCPDLNVNETLGNLLEIQLSQFVLLQNASFGSLHLWDSGTEALYLVAQSNFQSQFARDIAVVRPGDGSVCGKAADSGKSVFAEDIQANSAFRVLRSFALQNGIHGTQSTPILSSSGKLLGVFSSYFSQRNPFTAALRNQCKFMANQIRSMLESGWLTQISESLS